MKMPLHFGQVTLNIMSLIIILTCTKFFTDGLQPYDGTTITVIDTVAQPLAVVIYVLAVAGILFSLVCCIFNFMYRKTR